MTDLEDFIVAQGLGRSDVASLLDGVAQRLVSEGIPLHRCYAATLSAQVAMQDLLKRRPDYLRVLPTPVADRAVAEIVYLPANVFLASNIDDIADALRKVERHYRQSPQPS